MRFLSVSFALLSVLTTFSASAHDVTISGTSSFPTLDGSAADHDGAADGVFTVSDGNLVVSGVVNCNDDSSTDACGMAFNVSGDVTIAAGGALYAENRSGGGVGGAITLNVGGNFTMSGDGIVSTASKSSSGSHGGAITAIVGGDIALATGTTVDSGSFNATGGTITLAANGLVTIDGNVLSGPSRALLAGRLGPGAALNGGTNNTAGGQIAISSTTFVEPAIVIGATANIVSQGGDAASGPITIDGCGIEIRGLIAALSRKDTVAKVEIRSGKDIVIDARDLAAGTGSRMGRIRADGPTGTAINKGVDIFASETITIHGASGAHFAITSLPGLHDSKSLGGLIRITSTADSVVASGNVIDDGRSNAGDTGGTIEIAAASDVVLDTAAIRAVGDFNTGNPRRGGGSISVRSYSGDVIWTNGLGEVRPVGSNSGLTAADQGSISLTACGTIDTTNSSFPLLGTATSPLPEMQTGVCAVPAPALPLGVPPLVTCNTPPVANDATASTNEDTAVTIALTGSDVDGDALTFSIVSGPSNGSLGPVVSTGPTSADVLYTPSLDYNGSDSFVFRADDGNGGTDDATATITIGAVNDAPSFLAGPSVTVLEDSAAQTYPNWVTSISPGPSDEAGQNVAFTVTTDAPELFSVQPSVDASGTLTFTPAANAFGSAALTIVAQDDGGTANGGDDTSDAQSSNITLTAVNDEPSFVAGADQSALEDAGAQSEAGWATAISAGAGESQTVTFHLSNDNAALFASAPAVAADGTLTWTPAADANGSAIVTVHLQDDGGTANGGDDTSASHTFTITVTAVNDAPSFTAGDGVTVLEDSAAYSAPWAAAVAAGPADESGQALTFSVSNDNNALFSAQPALAADGTLTFTAAADAYGSATVSVSLSDDGGTANGGVDSSATESFTVTVTPVNDEPSFVSGGDVAVLEDAAAYSAAWASGISAGANETQTLTFAVSNDNNALFSVQPAVAADGTLSFALSADANGVATVTVALSDDGGVANGGDDTSPSQTFTITVAAVNDAPSYTSGGNVTVAEDSGAYSAAWASAISAGPADEAGQALTFSVASSSNPSLFAVAPAIAPDGTLTFTLNANAFGTATLSVVLSDDGGTASGGIDASAAQSFDIVVTNVNDEPSFTSGGDVAVLEDSGAYSAAWATSISAGDGESSQNVTFVVSNDNNALFSAQPSISAAGVLTFTAAANAYGSALVTVYAQDDGGTAGGGDDTSASQTFTITVDPVNDTPSFAAGGNVSVSEDSGAYAATWATAISAGPNETQNLAFLVSSTNAGLFSVQPAIAADGTLTFATAPNAFGSSTVTVTLQDDGGTANGGSDTSAAVNFTITINATNDPPTFTAGGNVTVNEDSGAYAATWATAISAGEGETDPLTFAVSNDNNALFSVQPAISAAGQLTFTPAPNAYGIATVTVTLSDGIDTTAPVSFTIEVLGINDPPAATNDSWETFGNTELRVDLAAGASANVSDTTSSGTGVLDNDTDSVEGDPFSITGVVGCADVSAPFVCSVTGGTLTLEADGSFQFLPSAGATGGSFQYTLTDQPAAGTPASANGTVTIVMHERIWYVDGGAAAGDGTSTSPFNSFVPLNGMADADGPGDVIFVYTSTVNGSIALETSQRLLGQGVGLSLNQNLNGNGAPTTLVAAGAKPHVIANAGATVLVRNVDGTEVAGLHLSNTGGSGILVRSDTLLPMMAGIKTDVLGRRVSVDSAGAGSYVHDNLITAAATFGIQAVSQAPTGLEVHVANTDISSTGNAFDVSATDGLTNVSLVQGIITSTAGTGVRMASSGSGVLVVSALNNMTITGATAGDGLNLSGVRFDADPSTGVFDHVSGGTIAIGSTADRVGGAALRVTGASGDFSFGSLTAHGTTGGIAIAGTGLFTGAAGMRVANGGGAASATAGTGASIVDASIGVSGFTLTRVDSTGAANGIVVSNTGTAGGFAVTGNGSANSGGTVQNASDDAIILNATAGVALTDMSITTSAESHIDATTVAGLSLTRVNMDLSGDHGIRGMGVRDLVINGGMFDRGGAGSGVSGVHGVFIRDLLGTSSVSGATFRRSNTIQFRVENSTATNAAPGAPDVLTMSGVSFDTHTSPFAGDHISVTSTGGGNLSIVTNGAVGPNSFLGAGNAIQVTAESGAAAQLSATAVDSSGNAGGINIAAAGGATLGFDIYDNHATFGTGIQSSATVGINVVSLSGGMLTGRVRNNSVSDAAFTGIQTIVEGNGSIVALVENNSVDGNFANYGIRGQARFGSGQLAATIRGNAVNSSSAFALAGISLESGGSGAGHTNTICLDLSANTSVVGAGIDGFRLRQRAGTTFNLQDFTGSGTSATDVADWVNVTKGNSGSVNAIIGTSFGTSSGCSLP